MKNNILMNKRYQISRYVWLIVWIGILWLTILGIIKTISPYEPIVILFAFMLLTMLFLIVLQINDIVKMTKFPRCKVAEILDDDFIVYGYKTRKGLYVRYKINIHDITEYKIRRGFDNTLPGRNLMANYHYLSLATNTDETFIIEDYPRISTKNSKSTREPINYPVRKMKKLLKKN